MKRLAGEADSVIRVGSALFSRLWRSVLDSAVRVVFGPFSGIMALCGRIRRFCDGNPILWATLAPNLGRSRHPTESCPLDPEHGETR